MDAYTYEHAIVYMAMVMVDFVDTLEPCHEAWSANFLMRYIQFLSL